MVNTGSQDIRLDICLNTLCMSRYVHVIQFETANAMYILFVLLDYFQRRLLYSN